MNISTFLPPNDLNETASVELWETDDISSSVPIFKQSTPAKSSLVKAFGGTATLRFETTSDQENSSMLVWGYTASNTCPEGFTPYDIPHNNPTLHTCCPEGYEPQDIVEEKNQTLYKCKLIQSPSCKPGE